MAYNALNLSVLVYSNGFALWHYTTTDTEATVTGAGYFNTAADSLRIGDMILANVDTSGAPGAGIFLVNSNAGGVVDVANLASSLRQTADLVEAGALSEMTGGIQ